MFPALIILALFGAFGMIFGLYLFVAWMTLPVGILVLLYSNDILDPDNNVVFLTAWLVCWIWFFASPYVGLFLVSLVNEGWQDTIHPPAPPPRPTFKREPRFDVNQWLRDNPSPSPSATTDRRRVR